VKRLLENLKVRLFDWLSLDGQKCLAFGGLGRSDNSDAVHVRVCEKNRWHIDSHAYVFEEHRYVYDKRKDAF
jgi:hypothetical protein